MATVHSFPQNKFLKEEIASAERAKAAQDLEKERKRQEDAEREKKVAAAQNQRAVEDAERDMQRLDMGGGNNTAAILGHKPVQPCQRPPIATAAGDGPSHRQQPLPKPLMLPALRKQLVAKPSSSAAARAAAAVAFDPEIHAALTNSPLRSSESTPPLTPSKRKAAATMTPGKQLVLALSGGKTLAIGGNK